MAITQAMWVHGTAIQAEREGYFITRWKPGWGAVFRTQGTEWFHCAIPTPVIIGGKDSTLQTVFVFFKTAFGAQITALHVYDGVNKIKEFNNLSLSGDHTGGLDNSNFWNVNPVHIKFGLGLSIQVTFGNATPNGVPEITFSSAGADFGVP